LVVLQAADDRKQHRGMARPLLASLPEQFQPLGIFREHSSAPSDLMVAEILSLRMCKVSMF
jgi:hypothetical protein